MKKSYNYSLYSIDRQNCDTGSQQYCIVGKTFIFRTLFIYIIAIIFVTTYYVKLNNLSYEAVKDFPADYIIMYTFISYVVGDTVAILYALNKQKKVIEIEKKTYKKIEIIKLFFGAMGIQAVVIFINELVSIMHIDIYSNISYWKLNVDLKSDIFIIIYLLFVAPITEEILFRGIALKNFSNESVEVGLIMSSILFGLSHGNLLQAGASFFTGIIFASIVVKTGNILLAIMCHTFVNANSIIWDCLKNIERVKQIEIGYYSFWIVGSVVIIILSARKNIFKNIVKQRQIYMKIIKEPSMVAILSFYIFILIIDVWS